MVSMRMICVPGRKKFMISIFLMAMFIIYLMIYQNQNPSSLIRNPNQFTKVSSRNQSFFTSFYMPYKIYFPNQSFISILIQKVIFISHGLISPTISLPKELTTLKFTSWKISKLPSFQCYVTCICCFYVLYVFHWLEIHIIGLHGTAVPYVWT